MALDPSIALNVRPIQVADPLAQYGQIAQLQNYQTQNQLQQMQMREAEATAQERNALRQLNPSAADYETQLFKVSPQLGIQYRKEQSATEASRASTAASKITSAKAKQEMLGQAWRDISSRPSDANITAHLEDILLSPLYDDAEKASIRARGEDLLKLPFEQRQTTLAQIGSKPSDLRPHFNVGPTGIVQTPAFGGPATVVQGTGAAFQATPSQLMADKRAREQMAQSERHFQAGGYTYDLDRGVRIDRNGIATPLMQQAPAVGGAPAVGRLDARTDPRSLVATESTVGGGIPTGRVSALQGTPDQPSNLIPLGPKPVRVAPNELRDEVNALTKDFRVVQDAHTKIKNVANTGAGDMSLLYSFVKLLDPGSVVRESEFAAAAQSGSYGERIQGAVNRALTGQRLPDGLRKDFIREADNLYKSQKSGADRVIKQYTEIAKRAGLNPEDIIVPYAAPEVVIPDTPPPGAVRRRGQ
jgi:hypothetical protein